MRTKTKHNDDKDDGEHMSIDVPFGNWPAGEGKLQLWHTKRTPKLMREMDLRSGDIGVGNFKRVTHNVSEITKGVRCSLLLICHAKYFSTKHPYKKQLAKMKECISTDKRCTMCGGGRVDRRTLTRSSVLKEFTAWAKSL